MNLEPKLVEPGFVLRWTEQSIQLIMRSPITWFFLITMLVLSSLIPINIFFKSFIGLWFMLIGLELTAHIDKKTLSIKIFLMLILKATEGFAFQVYFKIIFYSLMFVMFAITILTTKQELISSNIIFDGFWIYCLGLLSLTGFGFQIFSHLFSRFFNSVDKRIVNYNCRLASKINYKVEIFIEMFIITNIILISMLAPILMIMLYPLTCSFIYVAFREIFLNKTENGKQELLEKEVKSCNLN